VRSLPSCWDLHVLPQGSAVVARGSQARAVSTKCLLLCRLERWPMPGHGPGLRASRVVPRSACRGRRAADPCPTLCPLTQTRLCV